MKKGILFALILVLGFGVVACNDRVIQNQTTIATTTEETTMTTEGTTQQATTADTVGPIITGVEDVTIYVDATFDPMDGVSATDNVDGDLTESIIVAGTVDTSATGSYFLKYTVEDEAGNKTEASRYVTVEVDPNLIGDELVQNGDFSLGWAIWTTTVGNEGGNGNFSVIDGVLQVEVTGTSSEANPFEPRLNSNVIEFKNGMTYEITFDAKADAARSIKIDIGQLLSAAPWFVDYKTGQTEIFDLSTDWQTFSFKFTMNQDAEDGALLEGQLLFEMGGVVGGVGTDNLLTTIYYDNIAIEESTPDADTTAPEFSGIDDITIETGTTFDALEGVTAFDIIDGDIALTEANVTGTVNTTTPGEYTLTYTVSDNAGNEATATRVITVVDLIFNSTDMIVNGDFEAALSDPAEWYIYEATGWDGAPNSAGTVSIIDGELNLAVTTLGGGGGSWILQAIQNVEFITGQTYKVTFDASADAARNITVSAGFTDSAYAWHGYLAQTVALTTDMQTFEMIFTVPEDNGNFLDQLKFEFGEAVDTVYVDNVSVAVLDQPEMVLNPGMDALGWNLWAGEGGAATVSLIDGEFAVDIIAVGNQPYSVQFSQSGIELVSGTQYKVTFDAYALTADRDIIFKLLDASYYDQMTSSWVGTTVSLTTSSQTFEYTFTAGADISVKFYFDMGLIGTPGADQIFLDNLKIEEFDGTDVVAGTDQVVNGTGDAVLDWSLWAGEGGAATMAPVDGEVVVDVTNVGSANWNVQLFQENLTLVPGATYTVVFTAYADTNRDINAKLIDANFAEYASTFSLTTTAQVFTYTFVYDGTATSGKIDFELGLINSAAAGTVTFDNILVFRNFNTAE